MVALRKESVDRNGGLMSVVRFATVALRKESVDRNRLGAYSADGSGPVALRKESVDRNPPADTSSVKVSESLSARRAWIEIAITSEYDKMQGSLSARRAWIEILSRTRAESEIGRRSPQGERG